MISKKIATLAATAVVMAGGSALAEGPIEEHAEISGPFKTPMEVTATCLECHEDAASQVMGTSHWTWTLKQKLGDKTVLRGKKNALNNFCISARGNEPRCTSCHVGYGWKDATFNFKDENRVDCLVCHDTTGTYKKAPPGSGMPMGFSGIAKFDKKPVDLLNVARNVGKPRRANCLACHANGGGGNAIKHGDIDLSLVKPTAEIDFHMAEEGAGFSCQDCHYTEEHMITGNAMVVSPAGDTPINCTDCHKEDVHNGSRIRGLLNKHARRVACQTCHIPVFAKKFATKMSWDWSKAKNPKDLPKDQRIIKKHGHAVYIFKKGAFTYEDNVIPTYAWYNGTAGAYQIGDKIDPTKTTKLNYPLGSKDDPDSKIHPFKVHTGKQVYDVDNKYLIAPKIFPSGPDKDEAFWKSFDWDRAAKAGEKYSGLKYSGKYGFAPTETWWPTNHMVSPASKALKCKDCHGRKGRLDWQALGYKEEPLRAKKRERLARRAAQAAAPSAGH